MDKSGWTYWVGTGIGIAIVSYLVQRFGILKGMAIGMGGTSLFIVFFMLLTSC